MPGPQLDHKRGGAHLRSLRLWFIATVAVGALSCSDATKLLVGAPCPCAPDRGDVCCPTTQTCLPISECPTLSALDFSVTDVAPSSGALEGGDLIEVRGAGFTADMQVRVGGTPCRRTTWRSAEALTCLTPRGSATNSLVSIAVRRPDGVSIVLDDAFRYILPLFVDSTVGAGLGSATMGIGVAVWDADGDGRRDVLLASSSDSEGDVLFLNGGGLTFEAQADVPWVRAAGPFSCLAVGDFDRDGREDLFIGPDEAAPTPHLLLATDSGFPNLVPQAFDSGEGVVGASVLDVDADGDLDVIGCRRRHSSGPPFYLGRNLGGRLEDASRELPVLPPDTLCRNAVTADFDRDGDTDLLLCGDTLTLLENREGAFVDATVARGLPTAISSETQKECGALAWVDVDADGDLDISFDVLTLSVSTQNRNLNSGTFIFLNQLDSGSPTFVAAARLDAPEADTVVCPLGRGFLLPGTALLGGGRSAVWGDFDLDGDQDLLSLTPAVYCVTPPWLYENRFADGEARFLVRPLLEGRVLSHATGSVAADLDGDGDLDVVSHQLYGGTGRAVFRNNLVENQGEAPRHLVVVGISDGDGDATDPQTSDDSLQPGLTFELDIDGPEDAPDFALGAGLRVIATGASSHASSPAPEARFGLAGHTGPVWARTTFPDGSTVTRRATTDLRRIELRDCAASTCGD